MICIIILFLINSIHSNKYKDSIFTIISILLFVNKAILLLIHVRSSIVLDN